jgi:hypothetical protein
MSEVSVRARFGYACSRDAPLLSQDGLPLPLATIQIRCVASNYRAGSTHLAGKYGFAENQANFTNLGPYSARPRSGAFH